MRAKVRENNAAQEILRNFSVEKKNNRKFIEYSVFGVIYKHFKTILLIETFINLFVKMKNI